MSTAKLIDCLEKILPVIQSEGSQTEAAMADDMFVVIAELKRIKAERDAMAEALAEAASELQVCFEALGEFANTLSHEPYEANRAYSAMADARKALEATQ
jgi:hypothetical protein